MWVASDKIQDVAFVFPLSSNGKLKAPIQGMARGYFVRFWYDQSTKMMKALSDWRAFPCKSDLDIDDNDSDDDDSNSISESFPRQVFNGVVAIQAEMKSGLNVYTEKQGQPLSRSYRKMHMSREVWHFTVHALEKSCGVTVVHTLKSTSCNKSLLQLAKHKKERRRKKIHRITLTGDSQLDSIAKLTRGGNHLWISTKVAESR